MALGDIGKHFPDTNEQYKGADSAQLLEHAVHLCQQKEFQVGNIDVTIVAQAPKMAPHIDDMRARIAGCLKTCVDNVNVKATTTEKLGFVGREEGIACHAVVLMESF
jgi:2-C-methyl-D-erythritol 2,4-cyclodiphosphate synthase